MNTQETARVVAVLMAHWTNHAVPNPDATIAAYQIGLADVPYDLGMVAAEKAIRTSRFFPTVAELRDLILDGLLRFPTAEEAWAEIKAGFSHGGLYREPEWSCAPVAEAVRAIGWRVLCMSPEGDPDTRERFALTFKTYRKRALNDVNIAALAGGEEPTPRLERGGPEYGGPLAIVGSAPREPEWWEMDPEGGE